jgi:hypothetical protein
MRNKYVSSAYSLSSLLLFRINCNLDYFYKFICGLFNGTISLLDCMASSDRMIVSNGLERM